MKVNAYMHARDEDQSACPCVVVCKIKLYISYAHEVIQEVEVHDHGMLKVKM